MARCKTNQQFLLRRPLFGQIDIFFFSATATLPLRFLPFVLCAQLVMCFNQTLAHFSAHENKMYCSESTASAISTHFKASVARNISNMKIKFCLEISCFLALENISPLNYGFLNWPLIKSSLVIAASSHSNTYVETN